jgi:hypothetical protein
VGEFCIAFGLPDPTNLLTNNHDQANTVGIKQSYPIMDQFSDVAIAKDGTIYVSSVTIQNPIEESLR